MSITLTWKPDDGAKITVATPGTGFYKGGPGQPDVFASFEAQRGELVISNGWSDADNPKLGAPVSGTLRVFGAEPKLAEPRHVTIQFGCAEVIRMGEPCAYSPPREWSNWHTRNMPDDPAAVAHVMERLAETDFFFDDTPYANPEQSKTSEGRVCQALWAGSLAAALGIEQDRVRDAAQAFVDFQLRWRHYFFYDTAGKQLTAAGNPWWRVGPSGWDGQVKLDLTDESNPYLFEAVLQHLAFDRLFELAIGFNSFSGRLCTEAYIEAVLTRPEFRSGTLAQQQRTHGYCAELSARIILAGMQNAEREAAMQRMVGGWREANGTSAALFPYPSISPPKTGKWPHGYPSLVDWEVYSKHWKLFLPPGTMPPLPGETCDHLIPWLEQQALGRGLAKTAFTFGPDGLWQGSAIVWQTAIALGGLCDLRDVGAPIEDIDNLIAHAARCIVGPGAVSGGIGATGTPITPNPVYNSYIARFPSRVTPGPGKNSTTRFICERLLRAEQSFPESNLAELCRQLAKVIWTATDYPSADAPINLETMGVLPIKVFGVKAT